MSCFLHDSETFNNLYRYIINERFNYVWDNLKISPTEFVKSLADYNIKAMIQRYGIKVKEECKYLENYTPYCGSNLLNSIQIFKLLQSIDYQCVDSDEYCDNFNFKFNAVALAVAELIISNLPGYSTAKWS